MKENWVVTAQEDGKKYWISRAMAVCGIILTKNEKDGKFYFLVEKRGPGCPDFVGFYCNPCGYLGWDETLAEACLRGLRRDWVRFQRTGGKPDPLENHG